MGKSFLDDPEIAGRQLAFEISSIKGVTGLSTSVFDATLMCAIAWEQDDKIQCKVVSFGDGVVAVSKPHDGFESLSAIHFEYEGGAPAYLTNRYFHKAYLDNQEQYLTYYPSGDTYTEKASLIYKADLFNLHPGDWVMLSTDGLGSFEKVATGEILPWQEQLEKLVKFKQLQGEFLQRRVRAFLKTCDAEGVNHFDDFSVAGISIPAV